MNLSLDLPNRRSTQRLGARLASVLRVGDVVFLEGPLGAGKTFLVRAIARAFGVPRSEPITSPTFTLMHSIESGRVPILHADLYRLSDARELDELGLSEAISPSIALIEWGARFADAIADDGVIVALSITEEARAAQLSSCGPRGAEIITRLTSA